MVVVVVVVVVVVGRWLYSCWFCSCCFLVGHILCRVPDLIWSIGQCVLLSSSTMSSTISHRGQMRQQHKATTRYYASCYVSIAKNKNKSHRSRKPKVRKATEAAIAGGKPQWPQNKAPRDQKTILFTVNHPPSSTTS